MTHQIANYRTDPFSGEYWPLDKTTKKLAAMFWTLLHPFNPVVCIVVDSLYITGLAALSFSWLRASKYPKSAVNLGIGGWVLCLFAFVHKVTLMVTSFSWALLSLEDGTTALVRCLFQTLGLPVAISLGGLVVSGIRWVRTENFNSRQRGLLFLGLGIAILVLSWMTYVGVFLWKSYGYYSEGQSLFP